MGKFILFTLVIFTVIIEVDFILRPMMILPTEDFKFTLFEEIDFIINDR